MTTASDNDINLICELEDEVSRLKELNAACKVAVEGLGEALAEAVQLALTWQARAERAEAAESVLLYAYSALRAARLRDLSAKDYDALRSVEAIIGGRK
jgi:hypothetical protein